jgi:hypothetical protein
MRGESQRATRTQTRERSSPDLLRDGRSGRRCLVRVWCVSVCLCAGVLSVSECSSSSTIHGPCRTIDAMKDISQRLFFSQPLRPLSGPLLDLPVR